NGQAQISSISTQGRTGDILDLQANGSSGATLGAPVFLFQRITYSFRTSAAFPNRLGLWRNVEGSNLAGGEEIMAPFDTSTRFRFYQAGDDISRVAPPPVSDIRGLDLVLTAISPRATSGSTAMSTARVSTSVFFKNVRSF